AGATEDSKVRSHDHAGDLSRDRALFLSPRPNSLHLQAANGERPTLLRLVRRFVRYNGRVCVMAPYPSGKGEVCKTFMQRFESVRRLLLIPLSLLSNPAL